MGSFNTVLGPLTPNADTDLYENTYRQVIPTYALSGSAGGEMRITFAHDGDDYEIGECWIGQQDDAVNPWNFSDVQWKSAQVTFDSGNDGKLIESDTVSDDFLFSYDPTKILVLSVYLKEEFPGNPVTVPCTTNASYEEFYGASQEMDENVSFEPVLDNCDELETEKLVFVKEIEAFTASAEDDTTASLEQQLFDLYLQASMSDEVNHCSLNQELPGLVLSSAYTNNSATLDQELPAMTIEAHSGAVLNADLPAMTMEANAVMGTVCNLNKRLPALTMEAHTGAILDKSLPALQVEGTASLGIVCTLDANLPVPTLEASALMGTVANLNKALPGLSLSASASIANTASLDESFPMLTVQAKMSMGILASLNKSLPALTIVASALMDQTMSLDEELPALEINAHVTNDNRYDNVILEYQGR